MLAILRLSSDAMASALGARRLIGSIVLTLGVAIAAPGAVLAQAAKPAPVQDAAGDAAQVKQIALTQALVDQFLAAKKDIDAILDKLPDGTDQPDPAMLAKLNTTAKKYKFDDYNQYDATNNSIGIVMAGIDPGSKQYIGPEAVIKKQIADVQADKQISAKDKKDTIEQLNASLPTIPKLQYQGNVDIATKNFDKLNDAMPQD